VHLRLAHSGCAVVATLADGILGEYPDLEAETFERRFALRPRQSAATTPIRVGDVKVLIV